jgi:hypothetical protein
MNEAIKMFHAAMESHPEHAEAFLHALNVLEAVENNFTLCPKKEKSAHYAAFDIVKLVLIRSGFPRKDANMAVLAIVEQSRNS